MAELDDTILADVGPSSVNADPEARTRQVLAERYELLGFLGAGGMGSVYRARDLELDELVALKMLRRELVAMPAMLARFRQEVKLARRVTHRNVARTFDIGEHTGERFLTMELVEGESLSHRLRRGVFPLEHAIEIAIEIARGLSAAHTAGVVHRDLKPDNVLLAVDRVVLTDFGIAHAAAEAPTSGGRIGTPAYMAPEQVEANRTIDARADLYAFGCLLYELLTGARAWPGDHPFAVASARLTKPPPDPRAPRPDLPEAIAALTMRCMARAAEDRPASIDVVLGELEAISSRPLPRVRSLAPPAPPSLASRAPKAVAVLPFENLGPAEDGYLADGLAHDLIDALSTSPSLRVAARSVASARSGDPRTIGRELGVHVVVEGTIARDHDRIRIGVRITGVADGFQLWSKRFDRAASDLLQVSGEIAEAIAGALAVDAQIVPARRAAVDPVAIDLYLRARAMLQPSLWHQDVSRALVLFEEARRRAPDDPLILSGYATARTRAAFFAGPSGLEDARVAAERAVAMSPHLGEAWVALATVRLHLVDPEGAIRAAAVAIDHAPELARAHDVAGRILLEAGDYDDGMRHLEAAVTLDPSLDAARWDIARGYALAGEWAKTDAWLDPIGAQMSRRLNAARFSLWRGVDVVRPESEEAGDPATTIAICDRVVRTRALSAEDRAFLRDVVRGSPRRRALYAQVAAELYGAIGEADATLDAIEVGLGAGLIDRPWIERCPVLSCVRGEDRFLAAQDEVRRRSESIVRAWREAP